MTDQGYVFAEGVMAPDNSDLTLAFGPRVFDMLEAILVGDCRRCGCPVDRRDPDPRGPDDDGNLRIPLAITQATDGGRWLAPICDGCADILRSDPQSR
jgi:hypothetical protein